MSMTDAQARVPARRALRDLLNIYEAWHDRLSGDEVLAISTVRDVLTRELDRPHEQEPGPRPLTRPQRWALGQARDEPGGPFYERIRWDVWERLAKRGLVSGPPWRITEQGRRALEGIRHG